MSTSFKDYIESYIEQRYAISSIGHTGDSEEDWEGDVGFQVFCETKEEDVSLLKTLTGLYNYKDEKGVYNFVVNVDPDNYPRQEFFVLRKDENGEFYYLLDGFTRRRTREDLYDTDECPPFDFEEVMNYYGDTSDCIPDKNITSADIFELM